MRKYQISIPNAMNSQIAAAHKKSKFSKMLLSQFIKHLITMGLKKYQIETQCEQARGGTRKHTSGYETASNMLPKPEQRSVGKIIPFPGVSIAYDFQNTIDCFLREIGYIK